MARPINSLISTRSPTITASVTQKYPGEVEPLIWDGIITSEEAGMADTLSAMGYAKRAKALLEAAYQRIPPLSTLGHRPVSACSIIAFRAGLSASATTTKRGSFCPGRLARAERHGRQLFLCGLPDQAARIWACLQSPQTCLDAAAAEEPAALGHSRRAVFKELLAKAQAQADCHPATRDHAPRLCGSAVGAQLRKSVRRLFGRMPGLSWASQCQGKLASRRGP